MCFKFHGEGSDRDFLIFEESLFGKCPSLGSVSAVCSVSYASYFLVRYNGYTCIQYMYVYIHIYICMASYSHLSQR